MATTVCHACGARNSCFVSKEGAEDLGGSDTWPFRWRLPVFCSVCGVDDGFMFMSNLEYEERFGETS